MGREIMGRNSSRPAMTLIELLVSMVILSILIALLIPSLQGAREAARRTHCAANLHQIGLALHAYHSAYGRLPSGVATPSAVFWSGAILAQLEQQPILGQLDSENDWMAGSNSDLLHVDVPVFRCPTSLAPRTTVHGVEGRVPATYLGCVSGTENRETGPEHRLFSQHQNGVLFRNSRTRFAHICDGTSATVMVGETLFSMLSVGPDESGIDQYVDHWAVGSPTFTNNEVSEALGSTASPIGIALNDLRGSYPDDRELSFSSRHPAGTQFVYCDGHVALLTHSIDQKLYSALGTRDHREVLGAVAY